MKNFFAALIIIAALIAFFSTAYSPADLTLCSGPGIKTPGAAGVVIPGNGSEPAEIMAETPQEIKATPANKKESAPELPAGDKTEPTEPAAGKESTTTELLANGQQIKTNKEDNKMDGMVISFWHGVVAVLIGESSALAVAAAWMKIKGAKTEK